MAEPKPAALPLGHAPLPTRHLAKRELRRKRSGPIFAPVLVAGVNQPQGIARTAEQAGMRLV